MNFKKSRQELRAAKKEQAATMIGHRAVFYPLFKMKQIMILSIVIIIALFAGVIVTKLGFFTHTSTNSNSLTIVEGVQELATLATAEAMVTTIIEQEDNKLFGQDISVNVPGTKRTVFLVVPATVIAGVDLQSITEKNIQVDEKAKTLTITIPHAKVIQAPSIQMDKIKTYSDVGIFRSPVNWDEGFQFAGEAKIKMIKEAKELGILDKAENSAVKVLTNFLKTLGYEVIVKFE